MDYERTPAIRLVSKTVNNALGDLPNGPFNFGLYFQKWLYVVNSNLIPLNEDWKRSKSWSCCLEDETDKLKKKGKHDDTCDPNPLLDNMAVSLTLFNDEREYKRDFVRRDNKGIPKVILNSQKLSVTWDLQTMKRFLKSKHEILEKCARAFEKQGYKFFSYNIQLLTPLIIGLGNEHSTEKGFRFDWTLGIPSIPSSSLKGVVRLAFLVNELNEFTSEERALEFWDKIVKGKISETAQRLFGCGEVKEKRDKLDEKPQEEGESKNQRAQGGKVIFFDTYPATFPKLKEEIMNCHYPEYYNKGEREGRGPTEDQQPNPQKFWAIDKIDQNGDPLKFVFRLLLHESLAEQESITASIEKALISALEEHGLGAKTAIGHGHFSSLIDQSEKETRLPEKESELDIPKPATKFLKSVAVQVPKLTVTESWEKITISWNPGDETITAKAGTKKAMTKAKNLVPEDLHKTLFGNKRSASASIEVKQVGRNMYEIIKIQSQT